MEALAQSLHERLQTTPALPRETRQHLTAEAANALQRALRIYQICYGPTHPQTIQVRDKLRRA